MPQKEKNTLPFQVDDTDRQILDLLQHDSKMTIKEIAQRVKMSNTPVFDRIKRLEREGFIQGYTARLNKKLLGYKLVAFCTISLERHQSDYIEAFEKAVNQLEEVYECYHIAGTFDYLLKIQLKSMEDYQLFISGKLASVANIGRVQSSLVMKEVKNNYLLGLKNGM